MGTKRSAESGPSTSSSTTAKRRKGFTVGPENLPDGTWKRKNQQMKRHLIEKAKLKKDYAKILAAEPAHDAPARPNPYHDAETPDTDDPVPAASIDAPLPDLPPPARHPDRQAMLQAPSPSPEPKPEAQRERGRRERRPPRPQTFSREQRAADKAREEAEARRRARDEAQRERERKTQERDRFRRAMAKARTGGKNGQRKLGRESGVLLEKVRRMVAEG